MTERLKAAWVGGPTDDELSTAALRELRVPRISSHWPSDREIEDAENWVTKTQFQVNRLDDPRWRKAYQTWIDYVMHKISYAKEENLKRSRVQRLEPPKLQ